MDGQLRTFFFTMLTVHTANTWLRAVRSSPTVFMRSYALASGS